MRIGTNLPVDFRDRTLLHGLFGSTNLCRTIRSMGCDYVELSLTGELEEAAVLNACGRIWSEGLTVDLHPYPKGFDNCAFFESRTTNQCARLTERYLSLAARVASDQGTRTVVNFHPAELGPDVSETGGDRDELLRRSQSFFSWIEGRDELVKHKVDVTAELQCPAPAAERGVTRIGDTQQETLLVVSARTDERGICWDTGHGYLGHIRRADPLYPPTEFLQRVRHVHLHDVAGERDHVPIGMGDAPVNRYCQLLVENGFDGDVTVELHHRVCKEFGYGWREIENSIRLARECLNAGSGG